MIWTELLDVKNLEVRSFLEKEKICKEIDIDIIDKDVPRSLHELYPDNDEEKVIISFSFYFLLLIRVIEG